MARLRQGAGVMMLAAVAFNASGMTSALKGANGIADQLENALLSLAQPSSTQVKLQPVADATTSSQLPSLSGGTGWVNGDPVTSEALRGKLCLSISGHGTVSTASIPFRMFETGRRNMSHKV